MFVCVRAAVGDGGAERLDSHPSVRSGEQSHQDLHDPDRRVGQPPERTGHAHAADQSLHSRGGELHRQIPTMHHCRLHDVPHHQMTRASARMDGQMCRLRLLVRLFYD